METAPTIDRLHPANDDVSVSRRIRMGAWLLPAFGLLTLWATLSHQPDPTTGFASWARFVTTGEFLAKHLLGSIFGLALNIIGVASVAFTILLTGRHTRAAVWGFILTVLGSAGLLAGFGVAAFAQPAIGSLELQQFAGAHAVYDDVYGVSTFVTLIGGGLLFAVATVLMGRSSAAIGAARWARLTYASSGPLIALLGVGFGPLQTVGSVAAIVGGTAIALAVRRADASVHLVTKKSKPVFALDGVTQ